MHSKGTVAIKNVNIKDHHLLGRWERGFIDRRCWHSSTGPINTHPSPSQRSSITYVVIDDHQHPDQQRRSLSNTQVQHSRFPVSLMSTAFNRKPGAHSSSSNHRPNLQVGLSATGCYKMVITWYVRNSVLRVHRNISKHNLPFCWSRSGPSCAPQTRLSSARGPQGQQHQHASSTRRGGTRTWVETGAHLEAAVESGFLVSLVQRSKHL